MSSPVWLQRPAASSLHVLCPPRTSTTSLLCRRHTASTAARASRPAFRSVLQQHRRNWSSVCARPHPWALGPRGGLEAAGTRLMFVAPEARLQHNGQQRSFHDYFVTHLPSTSMHPDSRISAGPRHNLPRDESKPHEPGNTQPASLAGAGRDTTVVRIPLKSAKHHYGAANTRGTRPYNEDTYQAGTIELPSFARKPPMSVMGRPQNGGEASSAAESSRGDPQVFYFGVFDGHGGDKCSIWLRENLHLYLESAAERFHMVSTLNSTKVSTSEQQNPEEVQLGLTNAWKDTVGGYFRLFQPDFLAQPAGGRGKVLVPSEVKNHRLREPESSTGKPSASSLESVLCYSFLRADLDFVTDTSSIVDPGTTASVGNGNGAMQEEEPEDEEELSLGRHTHHSAVEFLGGSTCSVALISTPTSAPFWHPSSPFSIATAHCGDTRILLCSTATGDALALTPIHHPSSQLEAARLRRYAATFATDSFGEERVAGLANTRAFGDRRSKRVGVSAEPSLTLLHAGAGEYAFLVLVSDGVTAVLADQDIVDVVKEARTPETAAAEITALATDIAQGELGDSDNATALVVRLGGWERRSEGGNGSLGTKESREKRRREATERGGRR